MFNVCDCGAFGNNKLHGEYFCDFCYEEFKYNQDRKSGDNKNKKVKFKEDFTPKKKTIRKIDKALKEE